MRLAEGEGCTRSAMHQEWGEIFCIFQRTVIDGEPCLLDILDTAGQVEFTAMREQYMRGGEGFIICYSVADKHSFLEAEEYRNLILKVRQRLFPRKLNVSVIPRRHSQMMFAPRERGVTPKENIQGF